MRQNDHPDTKHPHETMHADRQLEIPYQESPLFRQLVPLRYKEQK